jgi:hypothetical protein
MDDALASLVVSTIRQPRQDSSHSAGTAAAFSGSLAFSHSRSVNASSIWL